MEICRFDAWGERWKPAVGEKTGDVRSLVRAGGRKFAKRQRPGHETRRVGGGGGGGSAGQMSEQLALYDCGLLRGQRAVRRVRYRIACRADRGTCVGRQAARTASARAAESSRGQCWNVGTEVVAMRCKAVGYNSISVP